MRMRQSLLLLAGFLCAGALLAERITLPAAASIVGGAPFFSDVRAFNTSYTDTLSVTATYRCFIGCSGNAPTTTFTLAPRQSQAFDDMVATTFTSPNTAGGVEFDFSGGSDQLVVTSRLFSTVPEPTVGMFIPALQNSDAHPTTVLTSIRNGGANQGFRTNVGVFNPEDSAVNVTFSIFDENGAAIGTPVTRSVPGHSGVQVSGIFNCGRRGGDADGQRGDRRRRGLGGLLLRGGHRQRDDRSDLRHRRRGSAAAGVHSGGHVDAGGTDRDSDVSGPDRHTDASGGRRSQPSTSARAA